MKYTEKLTAIRALMKASKIDAYIIPSSDPHISEYLPEHYRCIFWATGFTGSAGTLVITQDFSGVWTDSRYFVQANQQLADSGTELVKLKVPYAAEYIDWLAQRLVAGQMVGFDGNLASVKTAHAIKSQLELLGININGHVDLLHSVWKNRPQLPINPAYLLSIESTGKSTVDKLSEIRTEMKIQQAESHLISSLDDLAWIFNIRGTDVKCNPVVLAFGYITQAEACIFISNEKLSEAAISELNMSGVTVKEYHTVYQFIEKLTVASVLLDPSRTCFSIFNAIPKDITVKEATNPSTILKAVKNSTEITHTRQTMIRDGIAMTRFFKWVEEHSTSEKESELSLIDKLKTLREEQPGFKDVSFETIMGYRDHGALPHYKAEKNSNYELKAAGLLLVDSGGQYATGTTDITRVVSLGKATLQEKEDYTIVLKGMIEGSMAVFTKGTRGYQIDAITRRPIWAAKRNYSHGTGHGVGFFLNVHEGPQTFSSGAVDVAILPGMISSIEPGIYREGKYGIRIENLVLSQNSESNEFGAFMDFETLTVCYISTDLVEKKLLHPEHVDWLNQYNEWVFRQLSPELNKEENAWLRLKTQAI